MTTRMFTAAALSAFLAATLLALPFCRADNPIIQTKFTADPAPLVYNGRLYLYTSHDDDNATGFTMYNWLLYSTTDMVNWTDHGIVAGVADPYKTFKWADGVNAWAPQVVARDGKFYLFAPFPRAGHMVIGVAVANDPTGPFVDAIGGPLIYDANSSDDIALTIGEKFPVETLSHIEGDAGPLKRALTVDPKGSWRRAAWQSGGSD